MSHLKNLEDIAKEDPEIILNRVWFNLMRAHRNLYPKMEKILKAHGLNSPLWHEILLEVEKAGDSGVRSNVLQETLFMSQYNLSRHLTRLVKEGLIERQADPIDRRNQRLTITGKGKTLNADIWEHYHEAIQTTLAGRFDGDEAYQLFRLLIRLYP